MSSEVSGDVSSSDGHSSVTGSLPPAEPERGTQRALQRHDQRVSEDPVDAPHDSPRRLSPEELRTLFLFEHLSDSQLQRIAAAGRVLDAEPGWLYRQGEEPRWLFILLEGALALHHRTGDEDLELGRTRQRGVYAGAWETYMGEQAPTGYNTSLRVLEPSRFFTMPAAEFGAAVREWFPMAVHLLAGLRIGLTETQRLASARERLIALGSLTAGLTHELGNPAAALSRSVAQLREEVAALHHDLVRILPGGAQLAQARDDLAGRQGPAGNVLARADAEDALLEVLEDLGVGEIAALEEGSTVSGSSSRGLRDGKDAASEGADDAQQALLEELATTLAEHGARPEEIAALAGAGAAGSAAEPGLEDGPGDGTAARGAAQAVVWLARTLAVDGLVAEAAAASARISALLASAGSYAQLDRAPTRWVDVRELIDASIDMLGAGAGRAPRGVGIVREYAEVPQVLAHAGELTQVWTNLLDNALDALAETPERKGRVIVRVGPDTLEGGVVVEVIDNGPGIDPEVLPRIFEPFVTTKGVGQGTGLGLDIAWRVVVQRHRGRLTVTSEPGRTVFRVWLPADLGAVDPGGARRHEP